MGDHNAAARILSSPFSDADNNAMLPIRQSPNRTSSPIWTRRSLDSNPHSDPYNNHHSSASRPRTVYARYLNRAIDLQRRALAIYATLTPLQRAGLIIALLIGAVLFILFLAFTEHIFAWLGPGAKSWRELPGGWLILWVLTFIVSFPPLIGYSTLVTIAGFVFGMWGWPIMASATVIGSTCAFVVSRTVLKEYVVRMTEKNKQFAALALVLKHDGLGLLCMIRLCPLPYSFASGAISTIPTVTWQNFMLATAIASPKLLLHIFIGARLGDIAENGGKMDTKTKIISYVSIIIGVSVGATVGYLIYVRTKARAKALEAEEAAVARHGSHSDASRGDYADDSDEAEAVRILRREDEISLHTAYDDDLERGYRDEFTDDEDASERDVFDIGDGEDEDIGGKGNK